MTDAQTEKIKQFINDTEMNEAVKEVLLASFLKGREGEDYHSKAARFIALEKLEASWTDLESFKERKSVASEGVKQVGM